MNVEERIYQQSPAWLRDVLMTAHGMRIKWHRYGAPMERLSGTFHRLAYAGRDIIESYQLTRLKQVLKSAEQGSEFYRQLFRDAGISAESFGALSDLRRIPLLTKETLRSHESAILNSSISKSSWQHGHTSGTTGSPLSLWYDRETCQANNAADAFQKRLGGMSSGDWVAMLLGRQVTPSAQARPPYWQRNYALRQLWFSSLHMNPRTLPLYAEELHRSGVSFLEGYPSTLYIFAKHLLDRGQVIPLKAVFSSSETLLDLQRETIEQAFQAPLFDFFGHAERTIFAVECKAHHGKHLLEPYGITEVVDDQGTVLPDGEFGYLVGTSLFNVAMPLIRYRTGDVSAIESATCECGMNFKRIVGVSTKAEDIVVLPDGRWLSPSALTHPFKPFPQIIESQIVQEAHDWIVVRVVANSDFTEDHQAALLSGLMMRLGEGVRVEISRVEHIPRERSGKFRWVISKVKHDFALGWTS